MPARITTIVATLSSIAGTALADHHMTYRDADAVAGALADLASNSSHTRVLTIGYSPDYRTGANPPTRYPIHAIRISATTNTTNDDDESRNSILFECGTHAREWLSTESCLALAEYLAAHATDSRSGVPAALEKSDVWIVPLTNVAGRKADDTHHGDPTHYSTSPDSRGWRGNGDDRDCRYATDVARNYSSGWSGAAGDCAGDDANKYRGFAPFSSEEATALRNFVQNHSISMAVVVHSNAQKVWNLWGDDDIAGSAISALASTAWSFDMNEPSLALARTRGLGGGQGQFSAWLSSRSDHVGQPDEGTRRGIQTIFVELPVSDYNDRWASPNGTGNGFHPSSDDVLQVIQRKFIPMAKLLAAASAIPGCIPQYGCPERDFGLVGAKISSTRNHAGNLETYSATKASGVVVPARDYLAAGSYSVAWRVQNFSSVEANHDVEVELTVDDGRNQSVQRESLRNLALNETRSGRFPVTFSSGNDYTVTLRVIPAAGHADTFSSNDKKVFKFRAYLFQ